MGCVMETKNLTLSGYKMNISVIKIETSIEMKAGWLVRWIKS